MGVSGAIHPSILNGSHTINQSTTRRLLDSGATRSIHFYTLNLEKSVRVILEVMVVYLPCVLDRPWKEPPPAIPPPP